MTLTLGVMSVAIPGGLYVLSPCVSLRHAVNGILHGRALTVHTVLSYWGRGGDNIVLLWAPAAANK